MTPTDEQIEAAWQELIRTAEPNKQTRILAITWDDLRYAITVALQAVPAPALQIKPLEWWVSDTGDHCADTLIGRYQVQKVTANRNFRLFVPGNAKEVTHPVSTYWPEAEAKAAAQADYEARIRSAHVASHERQASAVVSQGEADLVGKLAGLTVDAMLIDEVAIAFRLSEEPWADLPERYKRGWRADAVRAIAVVKEYLTTANAAPAVAEHVRVECVPCVTHEHGFEEPADPLWRIDIDGFCADFETETAAQNFAEAINRRNAASAHAVADGWLPIETAPKDGAWVLLYVPGHGPVRARYNLFGARAGISLWESHNSGRSIIKGTHWMPLPAAPASASPAGEDA